MKNITKDAITITKAKLDDTTGFLTAPVTLARVGVQHYYGVELGLADRASDKIGVFRPPGEVFDEESINSFVNLVSTDDHPSMPVTTSNVNVLQVGMVSGVEAQKDDGVLNGVVTITNKAVISKIKDGKIEVSVGYSHELKEEKGVYKGIDYDFVQTNIRANHLAIVDAGRCGSACKITLDHKKEKSMVTTIDGIEYNIEDTQLAQAIKKQQAAYDAEVENLKKEKEKADEEKEEMKKEKDKAEAAKDSLMAEASKFSDDAITKMVSDKAILLSTAKNILGDKMPECVGCDMEIKAAVVDHVNGLDVSGKSEEYINAAYDMAIAKAEKTKDKIKKLNDDFQKDTKANRQTAHEKYVADHLGQGGDK